jgi:hypothetical protein
MGHESFAKMMDLIGNEVVSGLMQNEIRRFEANLYRSNRTEPTPQERHSTLV